MARCALFTVKPRGYLRPRNPSLRGGIGSKPIPSSFFSGPGKQSGAEECKPDAGKLPAARFFFQNCNAKQPARAGLVDTSGTTRAACPEAKASKKPKVDTPPRK